MNEPEWIEQALRYIEELVDLLLRSGATRISQLSDAQFERYEQIRTEVWHSTQTEALDVATERLSGIPREELRALLDSGDIDTWSKDNFRELYPELSQEGRDALRIIRLSERKAEQLVQRLSS